MDAATIGRVRSFNRTVTERVGALHDHYLGRRRSLGESRLLWEIGPNGVEIRDLRARLALDSGYTSRLLRSLEAQGLVVVEASPADRRVRIARLTPAGLAERDELDRLSDELARGLLEPLDESRRRRLAGAMEEVERLLLAPTISIAPEDPATDDATWCFERYFEELARRFEGGFDPSRSIPAGTDELRPPRGLLLLARLRGEPVGCGALKHHPGAPSELKRMWVAPAVRGIGLGARLLRELEARAVAAGATAIRLETSRALVEAVELYRRAGYVETAPFNDEPYADHWFEKRLSES